MITGQGFILKRLIALKTLERLGLFLYDSRSSSDIGGLGFKCWLGVIVRGDEMVERGLEARVLGDSQRSLDAKLCSSSRLVRGRKD